MSEARASGAHGVDGELRRLHPASPVFQILSQLSGMIAPLVVFVVSPPVVRAAMVFFIGLGLTIPILRYFFYRYRFGHDELLIKEGLLQRNERRIPYGRIQNLDLVQNPLHRVFKVAEVRLETASGSQAEAVMRVLSLDAVEELRGVLRHRTESTAGVMGAGVTAGASSDGRAAEAGRVLLRLPITEVARLGLVSNRGMVVIAATLGFITQQADMLDWEDLISRAIPWVTDRLPESLDPGALNPESLQTSWMQWLVLGVLGGLVALGLLYSLSIALAILRFYDFTLRLVGDHLRSEFGLLTRAAATTPRRRIQRLRVRSGMIERLLDRAAVRVDTAGGSSSGGGGGINSSDGGLQRSKQWLAPILPRADVNRLIEQALPDVRPEPEQWTPIAQRAWKREFRQGLVFLTVILLPTSFFTLWALLLGVVFVPLLAYTSRRTVRAIGWGLDANALHVRSGWLGHRRGIVRLSKVQSVSIRRSPFDRRHRMASLRVDTAGSGAEYAVNLPYLDEDTALRLATMLNREAANRRFLWT